MSVSNSATDALAAVPFAFAVFSGEGTPVAVTDAFAALTGLSVNGQWQFRNYAALLGEGHVKASLRNDMVAGKPLAGYVAMPDGRVLHFNHSPLRDERPGLFCLLEDVTDRFEELRISHVLRELVDKTVDAIGMADTEHVGFFINQRLEQMLGISNDDLAAEKINIETVQPDGIGEYTVAHALELAQENGFFSTEAKVLNMATGEKYIVSQVITAHTDLLYDRPVYSAIMRDISDIHNYRRELEITNQKLALMLGRSEEELQQRRQEAEYSHQLWRSIVDHKLNLVIIADGAGEILFANKVSSDVSGRELCGKSVFDLVSPQGQAVFQKYFSGLLSGTRDSFTLESEFALTRDISFTGLASVSAFVRGDGQRVVTMLVADVSEGIRDRQRLLESKKFAATGRMAARLAHEINNPIAGIKSALSIVTDELPPSSIAYRYVTLISTELDRVSRIIKQLYGLYRPQQESPSRLLIRDVVSECLLLLDARLRAKDISVVLSGGRSNYVFVADNGVRQVILNVLGNALEACDVDGAIRIRILLRGEWTIFAVRDTGYGLGEIEEDAIFEPFFSTKKASSGGGLGLGMAVSRDLARSMGGDVRIRNRRHGAGALCVVFLPRAR